MIKIDDNFRIEHDGFRGCTLIFSESRKRKKVDSKTRKETGEVEDYIFEDRFYYPQLSLALEKYASLETAKELNLEDHLKAVKKLTEKIEQVRVEFEKHRTEFFK